MVGGEVVRFAGAAEFHGEGGCDLGHQIEAENRTRSRGQGKHHGPAAVELEQVVVGLDGVKFQLGTGADGRRCREIGWVRDLAAWEELSAAVEPQLEFAQLRAGREIARAQTQLAAQGCGDAYGLAACSASGHDTRRAERHVRRADDASGEEEVGDVLAVVAAVGDAVNAFRVPLRAAGKLGINAIRRMQIHGPTAVGENVFEVGLLDKVLLADHVVALEAAALALARNSTDPLEVHRFSLGELAGVLEVVPDSVDDFPQLPLDVFGLVDGVEASAVFEPPKIAALHVRVELAVAGDLGDVVQGPTRRDKFDRHADVLAVEIHRVAEKLAVGRIWGKAFAELLLGLGAHAERGSGHEADNAIARGVAEQRCF